MFTSVPQDEAFRTTLETLANLDPFDYNPVIPDEEYMAELLRLVLYKNSFEFNDEYFLQISGVPMGQKSSGSICNLVVHELEKKILQSTKYIHTLYRYMDDTFVFWTGSLAQLEDFIQFINTLHGSLKFTYEASVQSIQFLDLVIYKGKRFDETGILDIKCHTKKTETGQFLHRSSCHLNPSSTVSSEVRSSAMQKTTTISTHLSRRKISLWRNFQPEGTTTLSSPKRTPQSILRTANISSKKSQGPHQYLWSSRPSTTPISPGSILDRLFSNTGISSKRT